MEQRPMTDQQTSRTNITEALRERLAALEHVQWERWSRTVAEQGLTPERIERWQRFWVPYEQLDEPTKDFDREWADKVLAILAAEPRSDAVTAPLVKALQHIASLGTDAPAFGGDPGDFYRDQLWAAIGTAARALVTVESAPDLIDHEAARREALDTAWPQLREERRSDAVTARDEPSTTEFPRGSLVKRMLDVWPDGASYAYTKEQMIVVVENAMAEARAASASVPPQDKATPCEPSNPHPACRYANGPHAGKFRPWHCYAAETPEQGRGDE